MSRTKRYYRPGMCLRSMKNRPHKVERSLLRDIARDFGVNLGNRALLNAVPEPYDDICISALAETKYIWKHG
jgi:hypothetical protein